MPLTLGQRLRDWPRTEARRLNIDQSVPRPVRGPMRWAVGFALIAMFVPIGFIGLDAFALKDRVPHVLFPAIVWAAVACVLVAYLLAKRALRRAAAADHLLCPDCTYDLRTLGEMGTCPECGRAYEHAAVRAQWLGAERRLKRGTRVRSR